MTTFREPMTPEALKARLTELIEASTVAHLRGYDLVRKLYDDEWQRLMLAYFEALEPAREAWQCIYTAEQLRWLPEMGW